MSGSFDKISVKRLVVCFTAHTDDPTIRREIIRRIRSHGVVTEQDRQLIEEIVALIKKARLSDDSDLIDSSAEQTMNQRYREKVEQLKMRMRGEPIPETSGV